MDLDKLEALAAQLERWSIAELHLPLCATPLTQPSRCDLIAKCEMYKLYKDAKFAPPPLDFELLWFPPEYKDDDSCTRNAILHLINSNLQSSKSKFTIQSHDAKPDNKTGVPVRRHILLKCSRGVQQRKSRSKGCRNTPSQRCLEEDQLCNCRMRVTYDFATSRYYIRMTCGQHFGHNNHSQPHRILYHSRDVAEDVIDLLSKMLAKHCPTTIAQNLVHEITGMDFSEHTIRNLQMKAMKKEFKSHPLTNQTTGEQLLSFLENAPEIDFIEYTSSREMSQNLIKIRKKKGRRTNAEKQAEANDSSTTKLTAKGRAKRDLDELIDALQIEDGRSILVAVAWTSERQANYFRMFPDVIGLDITHNTNAEKRPMMIVVARTSNGNIIPVVNAFFPSEAKWVFTWLFTQALPYLLGEDALNRVRVVTTDQCDECINAFYAAKKSHRNLWVLAQLRLCKWHKVRSFILYNLRRLGVL